MFSLCVQSVIKNSSLHHQMFSSSVGKRKCTFGIFFTESMGIVLYQHVIEKIKLFLQHLTPKLINNAGKN